MAPEQLAGKEATGRAISTRSGSCSTSWGKAAFEAKSVEEFLRLRAMQPATTPSTLIPAIGPRVQRAILHCLEPNPALRPSSALEVSASLPGGDPLAEALAAGETPSPEMVAASGPAHVLNRRLATGLLRDTMKQLRPVPPADSPRSIGYDSGTRRYVDPESGIHVVCVDPVRYTCRCTRAAGRSLPSPRWPRAPPDHVNKSRCYMASGNRVALTRALELPHETPGVISVCLPGKSHPVSLRSLIEFRLMEATRCDKSDCLFSSSLRRGR
jgi:hypothetical protein